MQKKLINIVLFIEIISFFNSFEIKNAPENNPIQVLAIAGEIPTENGKITIDQ